MSSTPTVEWPERGWARELRPGQVARLHIIDVESGEDRIILESSERLFEAPTWHPDGRWIVVNADGVLFRVDAQSDEPELERIPSSGLPELNNDHLIAPDGESHIVSANDGQLYRVPFEGGAGERLTTPKEDERKFRHFLHGVSRDGNRLAYVGTEVLDGDEWGLRAARILDLESGDDAPVGPGFSPADGPEFAPDDKVLYFNSEIESTVPGHAQLFAYDLASGELQQLTSDERVNWFPHPSPSGDRLVYLSYPTGTEGHPADLPVSLRLLDPNSSAQSDLVQLFGGQGTVNVTPWAPDGRRIAYVDYPITD